MVVVVLLGEFDGTEVGEVVEIGHREISFIYNFIEVT
jgi:hypothetical protein